MALSAIDHGSTRAGRWLRARRLRLALWIAVAEGLLIVLNVIPGWFALVVGAILVAFYFFVGRNLRQDTIAQASWVAATSQVLVALVPVLLVFLGALAFILVAVLAGLALTMLLVDRR